MFKYPALSTLHNCHFPDIIVAQSDPGHFWALQCHLPSSGQVIQGHVPAFLVCYPLYFIFRCCFLGQPLSSGCWHLLLGLLQIILVFWITLTIPQQKKGERCNYYFNFNTPTRRCYPNEKVLPFQIQDKIRTWKSRRGSRKSQNECWKRTKAIRAFTFDSWPGQ